MTAARHPGHVAAWRKLAEATALAGCIALLAAAPAIVTAADAVVRQPRSYGHVLGDVLSQRISLDDEAENIATPVLPAAARVNTWFERLPARVERDEQGRTWLRIDYQLVNAPRDLQMASLPELMLAMKSGQPRRVPEWPVSIGPLTPDEVYGKGELQSLQPDHAAAPYPTGSARQRLTLWVTLFSLTLIAWLGWFFWRNFRDVSRMPFARAAREVKRSERGGAQVSSEGWISLHRAFNAAAGRVIQPESLPALFDRAPYLEPLRAEIERFYAASSDRFFAPAPAASSVRLDDLSRRLRRAEKHRGSNRGA